MHVQTQVSKEENGESGDNGLVRRGPRLEQEGGGLWL